MWTMAWQKCSAGARTIGVMALPWRPMVSGVVSGWIKFFLDGDATAVTTVRMI